MDRPGSNGGGRNCRAFGSREIDVDDNARFLRIGLIGERKGAQKEIAGVGHDGRATRSDAIFGKKDKKVGEEFVYVVSALELGDIAGEGGAEVAGMEKFRFLGGMAEAETGASVDDGETAAFAGGSAMLAAGRVVDCVGVSG